MRAISVGDVVKQTADNLIVDLSEDEIREIVDELVHGEKLVDLIKEMEGLIFAKMKEGN